MSEPTDNYPFLEEWLEWQNEPMPEFGDSIFGKTEPSPAIDRLPEREEIRSEVLEETRRQAVDSRRQQTQANGKVAVQPITLLTPVS